MRRGPAVSNNPSVRFMKARSILAGMVVLGLCACSEDEETHSATEESTKLKESVAKLDRIREIRERVLRERAARGEEPEEDLGEMVEPPEVVAKPVETDRKPAPTKEEEEARRTEKRAERIAQMSEQITVALRKSDANGDGFLAKDEISGPLAHRFDDLDTNDDGYLDANEQEAMMESIKERMSNMSRDWGRNRRPGGDGPGRGRCGRGGGGRGR